MTPHLIIWDWDNTLLDTKPAIRQALNDLLHQHGHDKITDDVFTEVMGLHRGPFWENNFNDVEQAVQDFLFHYEKYIDSTKLFDGVIETLDFIKAKNIPQIIVSNRYYKSLINDVKSHKVDTYFDMIKGTIDHHSKPDLLYMADVIEKYKNHKIIVIGDGLSDMLLAENMKGIGILTGAEKQNYPHNFYCPTLADIKQQLTTLL